jgi:hypothetical protein
MLTNINKGIQGGFMQQKKHVVYGVHITERLRHVPDVQHVLSEYGCFIKMRLGLHEVDDKYCSPNGLILLEMSGEEPKCQELFDKLNAIEGVEVKKMIFEHPSASC